MRRRSLNLLPVITAALVWAMNAGAAPAQIGQLSPLTSTVEYAFRHNVIDVAARDVLKVRKGKELFVRKGEDVAWITLSDSMIRTRHVVGAQVPPLQSGKPARYLVVSLHMSRAPSAAEVESFQPADKKDKPVGELAAYYQVSDRHLVLVFDGAWLRFEEHVLKRPDGRSEKLGEPGLPLAFRDGRQLSERQRRRAVTEAKNYGNKLKQNDAKWLLSADARELAQLAAARKALEDERDRRIAELLERLR